MLKPLFKLAAEKKLPDNQFMDYETLNWIYNNYPPEIKDVEYCFIKEEYGDKMIKLVEYIPSDEWYNNKAIAGGIHGIIHAYRVTAYLFILNNSFSLGIDELHLSIMGLFHDIGRLNDKEDKGHGKRSTEWIERNKSLIQSLFNCEVEECDWRDICLAIYLHDQKLNQLDVHNKKQQNLINVLKTADAIDRYRLPKLDWWIEDRYLNFKPDLHIKSFAFNLIFQTEKDNINSLSLSQSIRCFLQI